MSLIGRMVVAAFLAVLFSRTAFAAPSLADPRTWSAGAGVSGEYVTAEAEGPQTGAALNVFVSRPLVDFAIVAAGVWDVVNADAWAEAGLHKRFSIANQAVAAGLVYKLYGKVSENEWAASGILSHALGKRLNVSLSEGFGFTSHEARTSFQLTLPIQTGRNP